MADARLDRTVVIGATDQPRPHVVDEFEIGIVDRHVALTLLAHQRNRRPVERQHELRRQVALITDLIQRAKDRRPV